MMSSEIEIKEVPERVKIIALAFGKKPYEEFKFKGGKRVFRVTENALEVRSNMNGKFRSENFAPWMFYAETE